MKVFFDKYSDDLEFQINQADLTVEYLGDLKKRVWNNSSTSSSKETYLHFNNKINNMSEWSR